MNALSVLIIGSRGKFICVLPGCEYLRHTNSLVLLAQQRSKELSITLLIISTPFPSENTKLPLRWNCDAILFIFYWLQNPWIWSIINNIVFPNLTYLIMELSAISEYNENIFSCLNLHWNLNSPELYPHLVNHGLSISIIWAG